MNTMDDELMKACALYSEICNRSSNGKGMSISEVKKKYGLKKRDVVVLLQFLIDVADLDHCVDFVKYNKDGEVEDVALDNLDESASDGSIYIQIYDNGAFLLQNRMDESELNLQNDTFLYNLKNDSADKALKEISNISDDDLDSVIISKGVRCNNHIERNRRIALITAILNNTLVRIGIKGNHNDVAYNIIKPLGLRYIKLQESYELIYSENTTEVKSLDVSMIVAVESIKEKYKQAFNIHDYISIQRKTKMILNVYDEGNVIKKLDKLLSEYDVRKKKLDNCFEYSFMVDNADKFESLIKSFGRSIIVVEPVNLRDKIYRDSKKALKIYEEFSGVKIG